MATSPLFGWEEPDDVDLVKDGAAAIRTLGNAIDTSMGDLLGGTSGQVLAKNSNTNMDFTWVTPDDANAIQNAIVDAKGDLIAATAADTPARLAVGTDGQVLTADSTAATGLKWATASSGSSFVGTNVNGTTQTISNNTQTAIAWTVEVFDTNSFHDNSTNNTRLTIPTGKTGYYLINARHEWDGNTSGERGLWVKKNGTTTVATADFHNAASTGPFMKVTGVQYLSAGDYIEMICYQTSGANRTIDMSNGEFTVVYLGA